MNEKSLRGTALVMLGCPQVPIQTSAALYLVHGLRKAGIPVTIAGTPSARALLEVADPERVYLDEVVDLDACIGFIAEGERDFSMSFVFVHNDAGVAYVASLAAMSKGRVHAVVFGGSTEEIVAQLQQVPCEIITARGSHNPLPMKKKLDGVLQWVVSNR
ncbi:MAG: DUF1890 domain-containing protein [Methanomicrobiales archaeon]|nr:DUF1890 domain-containing protein [Methanomicrobiales archaeon]